MPRTNLATRIAIILSSVTLAASTIAACSDDDGASSPPAPIADAASTTDTATTPPSDASRSDSEARPTTSLVAAFDPGKYELPEALVFRDGAAYVSFAARGEIEKVTLSGARSPFAKLPVAPSSFTLGSAFDAAGNLYVGTAPEGVFKVTPSGEPALWASSDDPTHFKFANALSFDPDGNLYVADAGEGAIYKLGPAGAVGTATPWKADAALKGDMAACPASTAAFPIGANGIFAEKDAIWVAHTDRGQLLRIAVNADGSAGAITTIVSDCATLEGLDGLRPDPRDPSRAFLGTVNPKNAIVSIARTGAVETVYTGEPFHGPADLAHVPGTAKPYELLVVSSSFAEAFAPADAGLTPKPSLVKLTLP